MSNKLQAYNQNIQPLITAIAHQAELLKDFKDSNEEAQDLIKVVKDAQEALKAFLEDCPDSAEIIDKKSELETELKEAISAAAKDSDYKAVDLAKYFKTRNKKKTKQVIMAGEMFDALDNIIES